MEEQLKTEGKTLDDAIENVYVEENDDEKDEEENFRRSASKLVMKYHLCLFKFLKNFVDCDIHCFA